MGSIDRRSFLGRLAFWGVGAAAWSAGAVPASLVDAALGSMSRAGIRPRGTTLAATITRGRGPGYRRLRHGPGWPTVLRGELAPAGWRSRRPRRALACVVQLSDLHLLDAESPARVEFLDGLGPPFSAAFRPQETLTVHVAAAMVARINALGRGPASGRPIDCVVSTGDNIDNQQRNELEWFMRLLDGGIVRARSGDPGTYEGVQALPRDPRYWHPDGDGPDDYLAAGYPELPGLLAAAGRPLRAPGLRVRWFSAYGNHDGLVQGVVPAAEAYDVIATGDRKPVGLGRVPLGTFLAESFGAPERLLARLRAGELDAVRVTPDPRRRLVDPRTWVRRHLRSPAPPGPVGHGYTPDHLEGPRLHYHFPIADGVRGVVLDTGGYNSGSIGESQLRWLERTLRSVHSRYRDASGHLVRTTRDDELVVVFSHFDRSNMQFPMTDPARPDERRVLGDELTELLLRFPNVVAWVNGHTHMHRVQPVARGDGTGGFWEITTASHVDWPQHARVVELLDNGDGTLSIICTILDHLAPPRLPYHRRDPVALASFSRELAANDRHIDFGQNLGGPGDLNVACVVPAPFDVSAAGVGTLMPAA